MRKPSAEKNGATYETVFRAGRANLRFVYNLDF